MRIMKRKTLIWTGVIVAAIGATAIAAKAYRGHHGSHHGGGYGMHGDEMGMHEERGKRRWGRWRRETTKADFDAKTRSRFARLDTNSDGVVDASEAEAAVERRMERRMRRRGVGRRMERMTRRFDTDRDGKVTKQEVEQHVSERFSRADLDGDGKITDADLPPMMRGRDALSAAGDGMRRGHRGRRGSRMLRRLRAANVNKDAEVTIQEMQDFATRRFARFDRNGDGAVDKADRDALMREVVDYRVRRLLHRYGAGTDKRLTLDQFKAQRDKRFTRLDINGDGVITRDERPGKRRKWRRHHRGEHGGWGRGRHRDDRRITAPWPEPGSHLID